MSDLRLTSEQSLRERMLELVLRESSLGVHEAIATARTMATFVTDGEMPPAPAPARAIPDEACYTGVAGNSGVPPCHSEHPHRTDIFVCGLPRRGFQAWSAARDFPVGVTCERCIGGFGAAQSEVSP